MGGLTVTVNLANEKVQFIGVSGDNPGRPVTFDYSPPIGDGQGYTGLELLLLSFGGCLATTVLYLLRRMGKNISGFQLAAQGTRPEKPPLKLEKIYFDFTIQSEDTGDTDVRKAIDLARESMCPVWQMLKNNVEVATRFQVTAGR